MSFRSKGLVLAMEEEGLIAAEPEVGAAEPEVVPAEVEQEIAEVQQEGGEAEDLNTAIEEAVEDAETIERTADVMEESVADGGEGIDEAGAEIAEIAVESLCRRLGITKKVMPALEGFKSANTRVTATRVAIEGFKDQAATAWAAVRAAFAKLWEKIKAFIDRVLVAMVGLKTAVTAGKKRLETLKDQEFKPEFENASIAAAFGFNGKANYQAVETVLKKSIEYMSDFAETGAKFEAAMQTVGTVTEKISQMASGSNQSVDINKEVQSELTKAVDSIVSAVKAQGSSSDGDYSYGPFVGGKTLVFTLSSGEGKAGVKISEGQSGKAPDSKSVPTLSIESMNKTLDFVTKVAEAAEKMKAKKDIITKFEKAANSTIDRAIKAAGKLDGNKELPEGAKVAFDTCRAAAASFGNSYGAIASKIPSLSIGGAKLALNYVAASTQQYGAKKEEKPADKAE